MAKIIEAGADGRTVIESESTEDVAVIGVSAFDLTAYLEGEADDETLANTLSALAERATAENDAVLVLRVFVEADEDDDEADEEDDEAPAV